MKKVKFAVAISSLLSGVAQAQSSVILYGVVDTPIEYVNKIANGPPAIVNNQLVLPSGGSRIGLPTFGGLAGSRWGLRGTEDLGNGLKVVFALESGFSLDTGAVIANRLFNRQAFVGAEQTGVGRLTFGRQYTSIGDSIWNFAPMGLPAAYEPFGAIVGTNYRSDNVVKYSGTFGGLTATAHYSFGTGVPVIGLTPLLNGGAGESPGSARDNAGWGAGINYFSGPLGLALFYDEWNPTMVSGQQGKNRRGGAAASYQTGPAKFMAGYRYAKMSFPNGATLAEDNFWWIGAIYSVTPSLDLRLGYYYDGMKTLRVSPLAPAIAIANPWQVSFIADYSLSKRTDVYLTTAYARNSGLNFDSLPTSYATAYVPAAGQKGMLGVAVGLRHRF